MAHKTKTKLFEWQQEAQKNHKTCAKCGRFGTMTVDHIVPISILDMLDETGEAKYEMEENFQYLCKICNAFKANRLDKRNQFTKEVLLKLLN